MIASYFVPAPLMRVRDKKTRKMVERPKFANANQRLHPMAERKLTTAWRNQSAERAEMAGMPVGLEDPVFIEAWIHLPRNVTYDAQNWYPSAKPAVDGLVGDHGMLPGDDNAWVVGPICLPGIKMPDTPGIMLRVFRREHPGLYPVFHEYLPYTNQQ